jgi:rhamnogalacturonan endolyase
VIFKYKVNWAYRKNVTTNYILRADGAANNLSWDLTPPRILQETDAYTNIVFSAPEGDFHWVLTPNLHGAYQYFVNRALPSLGEFRTLWRLDNRTFTHAWTVERDEALVTFADVRAAKTVKDYTLQRADGTYITKYDLSTFVANTEGKSTLLYWGVYGVLPSTGKGIGSWYVHAGKVCVCERAHIKDLYLQPTGLPQWRSSEARAHGAS